MKLHSTYVSGFFSSCKIPKSTYVKKIFFKSAHIKCTYDDGAFITLHLLYIDSNQVERERWKDIKLQKFSCFLIMTQLFSRRRAFLIFRTRRSKTAASSISSPPIKRTSGLRWPFNSCQVSKYLPQDRYFSDTQCSILLILASLVIYGAIMLLFSDGSGFLYSIEVNFEILANWFLVARAQFQSLGSRFITIWHTKRLYKYLYNAHWAENLPKSHNV